MTDVANGEYLKKCWKCRERKPVSMFLPNRSRADGLNNRCNECVRWTVCVACGQSFPITGGGSRSYCSDACRRTGVKDTLRASRRRYRLKQRYGMTPSDYDDMLDAQGGMCAICSRTDTRYDTMCVDHDHKAGNVRGLLCHRCNSAIGYLDDSPEMCEREADYIRNNGQSLTGG